MAEIVVVGQRLQPHLQSRWQETADRLGRVVESCPGICASEAVGRVRQDVPAKAAFTFSVLASLTRQGHIQRRSWSFRHCLFPADMDLGDWWQQVGALRDETLRTLYDLIQDGTWTQAGLCRELQERHGWSPSTTRFRVQRLQEVGLATFGRPGRRNRPLRALPVHPDAQEVLGETKVF